MNQLAIVFDAIKAVRSSDPLTSVQAAEKASSFASSQASRILQALKTHGPRSPKELEQLLGLTVVQIDRRLPDLKRDKLADVVTLDDGADLVRDGCRVWRAL